ncbi:DUF3817 domain-containing protein [Arthrobacter sp. CAN_A1]|uniref:DUF3817 domain-containing protein n=1 Tax=Arthrobacter sp. CAN_A1 TaxID=2787717 RepID=UPI0018CB4AE8
MSTPDVNQPAGGGPGTAKKTTRRFGGTHAQILSAVKFYKVLAYATGVMLLLVVVEMIAAYGMQSHIMIGGPEGLFSLTDKEFSDTAAGFNFSTTVLIVHGWMYVVYLIADFRLWQMMRWPFKQFLLMALGGVVPLLSFIVERRIHRQVDAELGAHPEAASRY